VIVGEGKYKSALFLLYLAELRLNEQSHRDKSWSGCGFHTSSTSQKLTILYFGDELCDDAKNNPQTKHTTIRDLLADGIVSVHINYKRGNT